MKTLSLLALSLVLSVSAVAQNKMLVLKSMDLETATCLEGDVETVVADGGEAWVLLNPHGQNIRFPKSAGKILTDAEATEALLKYVQRLYARIAALERENDAIRGATAATSPAPQQLYRKPATQQPRSAEQANSDFQAQQDRAAVDRQTAELARIRKQMEFRNFR